MTNDPDLKTEIPLRKNFVCKSVKNTVINNEFQVRTESTSVFKKALLKMQKAYCTEKKPYLGLPGAVEHLLMFIEVIFKQG